jgi:hypothetical protein
MTIRDMATKRRPGGPQPRSGAMLVFTQVSSMKTRRCGVLIFLPSLPLHTSSARRLGPALAERRSGECLLAK